MLLGVCSETLFYQLFSLFYQLFSLFYQLFSFAFRPVFRSEVFWSNLVCSAEQGQFELHSGRGRDAGEHQGENDGWVL